MPDDIILNKVAIIERCLLRIKEDYSGNEGVFSLNFTIQDAIILNILRACEASIDLSMHVVKNHKLGLPQDSRDAFFLLEKAKLVLPGLSSRMQAMVGFRNIAVHDYQKMSVEIVRAILKDHLIDFENFSKAMLETVEK